jgi:hypothetical protein
VSSLSPNLLYFSQLNQIDKIVEFWPDWLYVWDLNKGKSVVIEKVCNLIKNLFKFHDSTRPKS